MNGEDCVSVLLGIARGVSLEDLADAPNILGSPRLSSLSLKEESDWDDHACLGAEQGIPSSSADSVQNGADHLHV